MNTESNNVSSGTNKNTAGYNKGKVLEIADDKKGTSTFDKKQEGNKFSSPQKKEELSSETLDDALAQLKSYVKMASDFVQKRPVVVLATACAIGIIGAWALSTKAKAE